MKCGLLGSELAYCDATEIETLRFPTRPSFAGAYVLGLPVIGLSVVDLDILPTVTEASKASLLLERAWQG